MQHTCLLSFLVLNGQRSRLAHFNFTSRRLHGPIRLVLAIVAVVVNSEAEREHLVIITELSHVELMGFPPRLCLIMSRVRFPNLHHVISF